MKNILLALGIVAFFLTSSCSQSPQSAAAQQNEGAAIKFETTEHDFGTLAEGSDGTCEFIFQNTGKQPLVLNNVRSSCGCTVPEWPKNPINKGETGKIKVSYNTHITGTFSKSISVFSNATQEPIILSIKGKVEAAAKN